MLELFRRNYGTLDIATEEYFDWQYGQNPAGKAVIWLAEDRVTGELAGQYVVIPARYLYNGQTILGSLSLNTLTDARYRGQGVFTTLARALFNTCEELGLAFTVGFPNQNSYPGFVNKLEFVDIGEVPLLIKPIQAARLARRRIPGVMGVLGGLAAGVLQPLAFPPARADGTVRVAPLSNCAWSAAAFWERVAGKYPLMQVRDPAFLEWRYLKSPTRSYRLLSAHVGDDIAGIAVGRGVELYGMRCGMVVDLLVVPGPHGEAAGRALLANLEAGFRAEGAELLGALMLRHTQEFQLLRSAGFRVCPERFKPQPFPVIWRSHSPGIFPPAKEECFLTMGDYDAV